MSTSQIFLAVVIPILGSNVLTAFVTAYFTRPKTAADAKQAVAQADKTDAEAANIYFGHSQTLYAEVKQMLTEVRQLSADLVVAQRRVVELESEVERLVRSMEEVRKENVEKDKRIVYLSGILNDAEIEY